MPVLMVESLQEDIFSLMRLPLGFFFVRVVERNVSPRLSTLLVSSVFHFS